MLNVSFMKEVLTGMDGVVSFITLNQRQLKDALTFTINTILAQEDKSLILISLTQEGNETANVVPLQWRPRMFVIDAFSKEVSNEPNTIAIDNPSDLTNIQIAIERAEKILPGKKTIIFDAVNVLGIYLKRESIGRFMHVFTNKMRIEEKTALIFTIKESTEPDTLEMYREFADKNYDYSSLFNAMMEIDPQEIAKQMKNNQV